MTSALNLQAHGSLEFDQEPVAQAAEKLFPAVQDVRDSGSTYVDPRSAAAQRRVLLWIRYNRDPITVPYSLKADHLVHVEA